jgi:hypothetical protein
MEVFNMVYRSKFGVSPYKRVKYHGRMRGWIPFATKAKAVSFMRARRLKHAILYVRKK